MRAVPAYVAFFRRFIARSVERERHSQYAATSREEELAPRVDAQASDLRTRVGGWLLVIGGGWSSRSFGLAVVRGRGPSGGLLAGLQ